MIEDRIKSEQEILFRITKKEADFVRKLPRSLQDEFEEYQKLKYKFDYLSMPYSKNSFLGNTLKKG
jgi:hypothetical protein